MNKALEYIIKDLDLKNDLDFLKPKNIYKLLLPVEEFIHPVEDMDTEKFYDPIICFLD